MHCKQARSLQRQECMLILHMVVFIHKRTIEAPSPDLEIDFLAFYTDRLSMTILQQCAHVWAIDIRCGHCATHCSDVATLVLGITTVLYAARRITFGILGISKTSS